MTGSSSAERSRAKLVGALRVGTAAVWIAFGLVAKVANLVPRHRLIVARVVGETWAAPLTYAVGVGEILMGAWILSRRAPRTCAATQTALLLTMNALELRLARDLLLAPRAMIAANLVLLTAGWTIALVSRDEP